MLLSQTLIVEADHAPGVLSEVARVIAEHPANIGSIETLGPMGDRATLYLEIDYVDDLPRLLARLEQLPVVRSVREAEPLMKIYGKRVIIMGGGAQVGQVAVGAISEADRHNIRGERISVDTIPLVGEHELAAAVRAVARLPRARVLVLAGALMGGEITEAVRDLQTHGIVVISLNMVGSVRDAADLVVTDPLQAGVMAVMAVADTAQFDISKQRRRQYPTPGLKPRRYIHQLPPARHRRPSPPPAPRRPPLSVLRQERDEQLVEAGWLLRVHGVSGARHRHGVDRRQAPGKPLVDGLEERRARATGHEQRRRVDVTSVLAPERRILGRHRRLEPQLGQIVGQHLAGRRGHQLPGARRDDDVHEGLEGAGRIPAGQ